MRIECAHDELVELHRLVPNPKNSNNHPQKQIDLLAKIIDYQGQRLPIVVSNQSGFIVKGHGRLDAIKKLGWQKAAVDFQDYESAAQEHADLIADNKIAELAENDDAKINALALEMPEGFDFDLLGIPDFKLTDIKDLDHENEDAVPEIDESKVRSKLGDVYELGEHRLMCGDSTDKEQVEKLMNGEKADMVFTDPPYGMNLDTDYSKAHQGGKTYRPVINDDHEYNPEPVFQLGAKEIFLFGADYYMQLLPKGGSWLVWDKKSHSEYDGPVNMDRTHSSSFELCWSMVPHKRNIIRVLWSGRYGEGRDEERRTKANIIVRHHPTQKPIKLCEFILGGYSKANQSIVDLYIGSGSTLIACEKTNRKCFGMEIDPYYVDIIVTRWCKYTNQTKIKLNGKPTEWVIK